MIYQKCPYCGAENTEEELERNNYRCTCCGAKIPYETHVVKYVEQKQNSNIGKYIMLLSLYDINYFYCSTKFYKYPPNKFNWWKYKSNFTNT